MSNFTDIIRSWRAKRHLKQDVVAGMLRMSRAQYSKIESGEKPITIPLLVELAQLLKVSPVALFTEIISGNGSMSATPVTTSDGHAIITAQMYNECIQQLEFYKKLAEINEQKYLEMYRLYLEKCKVDSQTVISAGHTIK